MPFSSNQSRTCSIMLVPSKWFSMICLNRAIMSTCGDADDCISTAEATELAEELDEKEIRNLPRPGQVDFISGGPPCQVQRS